MRWVGEWIYVMSNERAEHLLMQKAGNVWYLRNPGALNSVPHTTHQLARKTVT